jgi:hypothetical protein
MIEAGSNLQNNFHLAGVVPVSGNETDFDLPWHDSMQIIGKNYLAVERAVTECAHAGCETIWVVCNDDIQPILKKRMGDYIEDPYYLNKHFYVKYPQEVRKQIPIFYTPIHSKDRERRDSYGWAALHGALTAFIVSNNVSKWLVPSRYFISFPYGVHRHNVVAKHRKAISSTTAFFLSYEGKTVKDGEYLSFTMDAKEYNDYLWNVKNNCSGGAASQHHKKRWSSKHFSLDKIFNCAKIDISKVVEVDWHYRIDEWEKYHEYIASEESKTMRRPSKTMFGYHEYSKIIFEGG